ncbi:hypothetical protein [Streptomyces sp. NPDC003247]|uniref:hypothetical protein n=1 Tax=Streptomyces sp. NPDC003247 TaxID=3364677 RepID=UPI0036A1285B
MLAQAPGLDRDEIGQVVRGEGIGVADLRRRLEATALGRPATRGCGRRVGGVHRHRPPRRCRWR